MDPVVAKIFGPIVHLTLEGAAQPCPNSSLDDQSFVRSCRIENLITDYEDSITRTTQMYGRKLPHIGADNFQAAVYFKIVSACRSGGSIVEATGEYEAKLSL